MHWEVLFNLNNNRWTTSPHIMSPSTLAVSELKAHARSASTSLYLWEKRVTFCTDP